MTSRQTQEPVLLAPMSFQLEASKVGVIFATSVIGFFAVMFVLGFFTRLSHVGPDEWVLGFIGGILLILDVLMICYYRRPAIVLTDTRMLLNTFFGVREVRYADLEQLSSYLERTHPPLINGTRMAPRIIHRLQVKPRGGKYFLVTLPRFGFNKDLLEALEARAGTQVARLPDVDKNHAKI